MLGFENNFKKDKVLADYREKQDELADEVKQIRNDEKWSDDYKREQIKQVRQQAQQNQNKAKEDYLQAIDQDIQEAKDPLNDELPEKIKNISGLELSKTEIKSLAEQYNDNYWAQRKLQQKAREQDLYIALDIPQVQKKVDYLKKAKDKLGRKFNQNPLNDGEQQRLKNIVKNA